MSKQLPKCSELSGNQHPHLLHTFAIDAEIAVARSGSGTKVNHLRSVIEEELHVIDEAEQQAGKLVVEVGLVLIDERGPRPCCKHRFQCLFGFRARLLVSKRRDGVVLVGRLRRDAIRTGWARRKDPLAHWAALYSHPAPPATTSLQSAQPTPSATVSKP